MISKTINNSQKDDFLRVYVTSFFIFFTPLFLSLLWYKKDKNWRYYFKAPLLSFSSVYILIYLYFKYGRFREYFGFFEVSTLMNAFIAFFTSFFIISIMIINSKVINRKKIISKNIDFPFKKLLLIPFLATIIYTILIFIGSSSFLNALNVWTSLFPSGIALSFITFKFLNYTYSNNVKVNFRIIGFYIVAILFFVLLSNISIILRYSKFAIDYKFYKNIIVSLVLFIPFFLFIISVVHLFFLKLVSGEEKEN